MLLPFNVACRRTLHATICAAACNPVAVICCWCNGGGCGGEQVLFVVVVSKHKVVVDCCFDIGSFDMNVPLRNRITSRGDDLTRRRVDERVEVVEEDFNRSVSLLLVELKPNVVVLESIRVASSAIITTLALGSNEKNNNNKRLVIWVSYLPAALEFNLRLAAALLLDVLKIT
jgi:hypothetical protein